LVSETHKTQKIGIQPLAGKGPLNGYNTTSREDEMIVFKD
jgi:hypothetical protein